MGKFLSHIGAAALGALAVFLIMHFGRKPEVQTVTKVATITEKQPCPEIEIDSIAIYETIRIGKLKATRPGKTSEVIVDEDTEPPIKMDTYVYEDSLLYVGESIIYQGEIHDFSRSIRLDTLMLEREFTRTITETEIQTVHTETEKIVYQDESRFNVLAGGGADVWPRFRLSGIVGFQTKRDQIFLYEFTPAIGNIDPDQQAIHSLKAILPIRFNR
jgi:hypothetical protein